MEVTVSQNEQRENIHESCNQRKVVTRNAVRGMFVLVGNFNNLRLLLGPLPTTLFS